MKDRSNYISNNILIKVSDLPIINTAYMKTLLGNSKNTIINLSRWEGKDYLIRLKKGVYTTKTFLEHTDKTKYIELIANKLLSDSYLSDTYILSKNGILTDITHTITSVTTTTTREIKNPLGRFYYRSIRPELFTHYTNYRYGDYFIHYAKPYKALFDYFYFRKDYFIFSYKYVESLRFNWENIDVSDMNKFLYLCKAHRLDKMTKICNFLISFKKDYVY